MSTQRYVNLDYAASTPMRPEAVRAQADYDASRLAGVNPNSLHSLGRQAAIRLEECRRAVAASLGTRVRASEIVFTGGGTEANVLALLGIAQAVRERDRGRSRVIVSAIEHDSILDNLPLLRADGFTVDVIKPDSTGRIDPSSLERLISSDVALVSVMLANNETGVVQPIADLARIAHGAGARMHSDAIQGWLHIPFDVSALGVDALSLAGHKVGGPVGIGALYLKSRTPIRARSFGGGQEGGLRPGTQDLRAIVALAAAASALRPLVAHHREQVGSLANGLYTRLCAHPRIHATMGDWTSVERLPGIVSIYVDGIDSEELILQLDGLGYEVSAGSACSSASLDASHVLRAMGIPREKALGSLRISFDDRVEPDSLERFAQALFEVVGA
ncbi:cysteine desulfurase family protein [Collinsella stercoris]|uniref:cysteine desulfurase n=1 Tax=Collinsella stercoris DSM 13279 TaxID=445975 RepID=B6GBW4_9ACTN|nr:cysteine desulfurase family protein [Collinsella stercoris]EEA90228.1 aminotransferase, class V [Collinsella stercoris DSM 13279]UEA46153.1 cysteine desulfurase [Collinsella stercoris DSM 13279]UWP11330.1 cysteine desulfurase [Collinsella stercoris]